MDNLKSRGLNAFIWDFFGKFSRHATGFIVTIILERLLEPSGFGLITMIMVFVSLAFIFTDVGFGSVLIKRFRVSPVYCSAVFYFNIFFDMLLNIITFFTTTSISEFYDKKIKHIVIRKNVTCLII